MTTRFLSIAFGALALFVAQPAFAGDIIGQQQQQGQIQGQKQGQIQGQYQNASPTQTTSFNDERQLAPVFVAPPSFGASVSGNSCAGTEAWSVGVGGAFFVPNGTGAPVSAGVGFGSSDVVTINLCEVRESAAQSAAVGDFEMAYQKMCDHPNHFRTDQAMGRNWCKPRLPYKMDLVENVPATAPSRQVASASPVYCEITDPGCDGS